MIARFLLWLPLMVVWISACSAPVALPEGDAPIRELYAQAMTGEELVSLKPSWSRHLGETRGPTDIDWTLHRDFTRLPNPRLVLYVHPHLSATGDPIPGYATWFTVFERALRLKRHP